MDSDLKVTYVVIGVLIVILGGLAYFLQDHTESPTTQTNTYGTTTNQLTNTQGKITTPTTTNSTTTMSTSTQPIPKATTAIITTNKGVIEVSFATNTPNTVANFAKLASEGFYNGTRFHRVIKDFMIQGGDPLSKDVANKNSWGTGGPGYKFADELTGNEKYPQGTLAMANSGPNTNGSQFFIVTANPGYPLPPNYTVFGHVTKGLDTALTIQNVEKDSADRPTTDMIIQSVVIK